MDEYWKQPPIPPIEAIRSMMTSITDDLRKLNSDGQLLHDNEKSKKKIKQNLSHASLKKKKDEVNPTITEFKFTSLRNNLNDNRNPKLDHYFLSSSSTVNYERFSRYKSFIFKACQDRRIFTIHGNCRSIRQALKQRGWLEKINSGYDAYKHMCLYDLLERAQKGNDYENLLISRLLEKNSANFIWHPRNFKLAHIAGFPYKNRIYRKREFDFSLKDGLLGCVDYYHWYCTEEQNKSPAPRCYRLSMRDEIVEFQDDFRLTACLSFLKFLVENRDKIMEKEGKTPMVVIKFAANFVERAILRKKHADIDWVADKELISGKQWEEFMKQLKRLTEGEDGFQTNKKDLDDAIRNCQKLMNEVKKLFPTIEIDGKLNIWIMKPTNQCRGHGITLMNDFSKIVHTVHIHKKRKYVIQKYIERPLLIFKTKFDIRQYFLLTITDKVNIWIYKDCYLRFSSQEFDLNNFTESIHLTNNAVQKKYKNGERSELLPKHNMWHLSEFQKYLVDIGRDKIWAEKIFPAMKHIIISIVMSSLEETTLVPNTFELYGCDFMITEDYETYLIEINSTPDMSASTSVTAKICPAALEDVIKVVIDYDKNPKAKTGKFELINTVTWAGIAEYNIGLIIRGTQKPIYIQEVKQKISKKIKQLTETESDTNNNNKENMNTNKISNQKFICGRKSKKKQQKKEENTKNNKINNGKPLTKPEPKDLQNSLANSKLTPKLIKKAVIQELANRGIEKCYEETIFNNFIEVLSKKYVYDKN